ncbi:MULTISPECIES: MarR family winged helix-turn-helix transcriptional regulator [Hyphomicrobium]|jgi:DNA-binding MarR family transcriptional regulator|uniref:MarR family winged helix-turn-helix transcriptional regulator n=1 Tax=Hyphomicrobium TaxID=81 RepID=UPI00036026AF|nr:MULTISPECIES: helix-turn-helix domain-containing protein [Hyphomicrobium]WBT39554.1 helix-turn-helix domain-containing protein [Hyphomicrobium sp. DMF-1]
MTKATPPRKFPKKSYEALADFRYALRCFLAFSEQAAGEAGLTPQQYQALLAIKGAGDRKALGIGDIAERLLIRHHTAVELVNRLEKNGFVTRTKDKEDARRVTVALSLKAEHTMDGLAAAHLQELKGIRPVLEQLLDQFDPPKPDSKKGRL